MTLCCPLPSHMCCLLQPGWSGQSGMDIPHIAVPRERLDSAGSPAPTLPYSVSGSK